MAFGTGKYGQQPSCPWGSHPSSGALVGQGSSLKVFGPSLTNLTRLRSTKTWKHFGGEGKQIGNEGKECVHNSFLKPSD